MKLLGVVDRYMIRGLMGPLLFSLVAVMALVVVVDVVEKPEMAIRHRLFCPFLIVVDDTHRLSAPWPADELARIAREGIVARPTALQTTGPEARAETVEALTVENIADTCSVCNCDRESPEIQVKQVWASGIEDKVREGVLGFIAYKGERAVSFAEFLPSPLIPYPLPEKEATLAVINCVYPLEDGPDYRGQVLQRLMEYLPSQGYERLQVIAGRRTLVPNGPVSFFLSHGFRELGEVDRVIFSRGEEELVPEITLR